MSPVYCVWMNALAFPDWNLYICFAGGGDIGAAREEGLGL